MYADTQKKIEDTQNLMAENIESVLERGEKLESLNKQTQATKIEARNFRRKSDALYAKTVGTGYNYALIAFFPCAFFGLSILTGQPWPIHIISVMAGTIIGWGANMLQNKIHTGWLYSKIFGKRLLSKNHQESLKLKPIHSSKTWLPSFGKKKTPHSTLGVSKKKETNHPQLKKC